MYGAEIGAAASGDGCRALWAAVLLVALQDALRGTAHKPNGQVRTCSPPVCQGGEAVSFLTDPAGRWALSREMVADAAGLDPEAVRARAIAALAGQVDLSDLFVKRRGAGTRPRANHPSHQERA